MAGTHPRVREIIQAADRDTRMAYYREILNVMKERLPNVTVEEMDAAEAALSAERNKPQRKSRKRARTGDS
jgi:hypothetical protein